MRTAVICMWLLVALCAIATTTQANRRHKDIRCYRFRGRRICVRTSQNHTGCRYTQSGGKLIRWCVTCYRIYSGSRTKYLCKIASRRTIKRSYTKCVWRMHFGLFILYRRRICTRCTRYLVQGRYLRTRCRRV